MYIKEVTPEDVQSNLQKALNRVDAHLKVVKEGKKNVGPPIHDRFLQAEALYHIFNTNVAVETVRFLENLDPRKIGKKKSPYRLTGSRTS